MRIHFVLGFFLLTTSGPMVAQESKENSDFKLAVSLYNDRLYDLALEQFRQFVAAYPTTQNGVEARFYLGMTQARLGHADDARLTFQNFALAFPDNPKAPEAWMNAAEAAASSGNPREAALAFERVKTFHPKSKQAPVALQRASEHFEQAGDRENAKRILRMLTQEYASADVLPARLRLAEYLVEEGDYESARAESKRTADATKDPTIRGRALLAMGQSLLAMDRFAEAESALREIITGLRTSTSYHAALLTLGELKRRLGTMADAVAAWKTVAADSVKAPPPIRQNALLALGEASQRTRDFAGALAMFERAARIVAPGTGEALYQSGVMAERLGNTRKANDYYVRALADTTGRADRRGVLIGAIKAAHAGKNFEEVLRLVDRYAAEFPGDVHLPRLLVDAGRASVTGLKDGDRAVGLFNAVLTGFPRSSYLDDALLGRGTAHRLNGNLEAALDDLQSLPLRFPSSEWFDDARTLVDIIKRYELKSREGGLEKLALLIGDVIAQRGKGDLAYRLAEIYFHELKDYRLAALQYRAALNSDLDEVRRPAAIFALAQSLEFDAARPGGSGSYTEPISVYDTLLRSYPSSPFSDDAALSMFRLKLASTRSATDVRKLGTEFFRDYPTVRRKDAALLAMGNSYQASKTFEDAVLTYKLIVDQYGQTESATEAVFQWGHSLALMGEKDSAAVLLKDFLDKNPRHTKSAHAAFLLASMASERGQSALCGEYSTLLEREYFYTQFADRLSLLRGTAHYLAGEYRDAVVQFAEHLDAVEHEYVVRDDIPLEIILKIASAYDRLGERGKAKEFYAEYLERDASSEQAGRAYYALAAIARTENHLELAAHYLQEAGRLGGGGALDISLETADLLFRNEQYTEAVTKYSEVAGQTKNDSLLRYALARVVVSYFRLDNVREADRRFTAFVKADSRAVNEVAEFEFERGMYHLRKDEIDRARQRFNLVLKEYPKSPIVPEATYWKARSFELSERLPEAVQTYDSLLRTFPASTIVPRAQLSLGNVYYNLEQWDNAARMYRAILDNESRSPDLVQFAMNNLILTYKEQSLFDGAMDLTRKYIERFPHDPDLILKRIDIGVLYQRLGYHDQSIVHLQSMLQEGNSDLEAELRYYMGEAYFYKGEYQQGILEFLKVPYLVTRKGPMDWVSTSYYMAGQSYEKMAKYNEAITMYRQIIDRRDTDAQFKTAAQREIDRVTTLVGKQN